MPLPRPPDAPLWLSRILDRLNRHRDELVGVTPLGLRSDGTTSHIRFEASRVTNTVRLHVQSTAVGMGGATYDAAAFVSQTAIDCREERLQDTSVSRNGVDQYYAWLVPIGEIGGTDVVYDGTTSAGDRMAFYDLGV